MQTGGDDARAQEQMERRMGLLLRWGVIAACSVVALGAALYLPRHGSEAPPYGKFGGEPARFESVSAIVRSALGGSGRGVLQLGCLVMIATPVLRVIFALVSFAQQRDWLYVGVSFAVLVLLAAGLLGGA